MLSLLKKNDQNRVEIFVIGMTILLFLFRTAIPLFKYPFLILYFGFFIYSIINYRIRIISLLKDFVHNYSLLLILALILFISFVFSDKIYLSVFKDLVNAIILLSIFFILMLVISAKREIGYFVFNFLHLAILFAFFISIFRLLDLFDIFHYTDYYSTYDSLYLDYNFALLPEFFGMIGVFYFLTTTNSRLQKISYNLLLIVFSFHIFLSGSRRGIILLIVIFLLLAIAIIIGLFKKNEFQRKFVSNSNIFLFWLILLPFILYLFIFHTSYNFKSKSLEYIGTKSGYIAKTKTSSNIFRYIFVFDKKLIASDLYKKIWSISFDPKDPDNGWGEGIYRIIFPLTGKNVEIVPFGAKGYLLDNSCKFGNSDHHAYSNTIIGNSKVNKDDLVQSSVYCYVSNDFNGNMVCIRSEGAIYGNYVNCYDLNNKGVWEKLIISANCNNGVAPVYLYFNIQGVTDFSTLTGYVIFAYPQYKIVDTNDTCSSLINSKTKSLNNESKIIDSTKKMTYLNNCGSINKKLDKSGLCYIKNSTHGSPFSRLKVLQVSYTFNTQKSNEAGLFNFHMPLLATIVNINDKDPFRNWVSKFISEDTTYHGYKAKIMLDTISNRFLGQRIMRWQFALQIFSKEYNWTKKLFGGGFNFLNWYGYYFLGDKTKSDYPHNPLLYILLYSGIVGLLLYIYFMYKVFYYYILYVREYYLLFIFFLITYFFTFFSGGNPFDPPMMGFFVILPFFIHSIHRKKEPELDDDHINQEIGSIS